MYEIKMENYARQDGVSRGGSIPPCVVALQGLEPGTFGQGANVAGMNTKGQGKLGLEVPSLNENVGLKTASRFFVDLSTNM